MGKIASNVGAASSSISGLQRIAEGSLGGFGLSGSNLKGMQAGTKVGNQLMGDINKLTSSVKKQADKFPQIARIIEARDSSEAAKFGR
ncbi:hypothetical protein WOSG25_012270 [Weissella oryzae SG25]|uniref:Uncharacterized protein n=1 Tax=Weissella oryzae (strain DSM 25784 / JCM 18191 / LMG 30913 / SG25) TaxID=1329250 RepID=A0A069CQY6_WEIOS|nr:hypothetical protein [Weissella oryzae]GAK30130.1 hypothetical protein WOSG25_012270 [Weissella oryzae SG25]